MSVSERERVKALVDMVPDEDLNTVARMLRGLAAEEAAQVSFEDAPEDDEGELTGEMTARLAEADRDIAEGQVSSHEDVMRRLGLSSGSGPREAAT